LLLATTALVLIWSHVQPFYDQKSSQQLEEGEAPPKEHFI